MNKLEINQNEILKNIFENKNNTVTLNLGDYESIKAVFDENIKLKEENEKISESLSRVGRIFVRAKIPEEVFEQLSEGKILIETKVIQDIIDPNATCYIMSFKVSNKEL